MARSENQSLQLVLIVFVILTLILSVTTFLFFNARRQQVQALETAEGDARSAQTGLRNALNDQKKLFGWIGVEVSNNPVQDMQRAEEAFNADKQAALDTYGTELQSFTNGISFLINTLRDTSARLAAEEEKLRKLTAQHEAREAIKQKQIDQFSAAAESANQALEAAQTKQDQDRRQVEQVRNELAQERDDLRGQLSDAEERRQKQVAQLDNEIAGLRALAESRLSKIEDLTNEEFEVADGEIRSVSQRRGVVWINLGRADYLRPQITFSVFGPDSTNVASTKRKGAIEIIDIKDDHLAEARIVEESFLDPLVPGDRIYTPLWHPGRQDHFALAGWMDLDGDGQSDRRLVRQLVQMAGGVIDAELDDEGNESGQMTYNTRFLIVGETAEEISEKLGQWQSRARELGVRPMKVVDLLDLAGWKQGNRVLRFGRGRSGRAGRSQTGVDSEAAEEGRPKFPRRPPVAAGGFRVR